jgi:signal transduction histidine kinase
MSLSVDRRRVRLLATSLLALILLGSAVSLVQYALVPSFRERAAPIAAAIFVLALARWGSRSTWYRLSACTACLAPAVACVFVALLNPNDPVWFAFMLIAVVFATMFFNIRMAAVLAGGVFLGLLALVLAVPELRSSEKAVPILAVHVVLSPLLLFAADHQRRLEGDGKAELHLRDRRLAEAERSAAVGVVASGVAHDFRNLLMVIAEQARLLEQGTGEVARERLEVIQSAIDKANALTQQLVTLAARSSDHQRVVEMNELVAGLEPLLARMSGSGVRIVVARSPDPCTVMADPVHLEQVLMNLAVNARDAMPDGGRLTIAIRHLPATDRSAGGAMPADGYVLITATDTGVGMNAETLARATEPFFTTKSGTGGTGLGLAIVQDVAERYGGHVSIASKLGEGTTVSVYLPMSPSRSP